MNFATDVLIYIKKLFQSRIVTLDAL